MKDAVKALVENEQGEILVLFRSETHPHLAHDIDLPGGEVDLDESIEQALVREIREETELIISQENLIRKHSWRTMWGQKQVLYKAKASSQNQVVISWEHESYAWMSPEDFVEHKAIDEFMYRSQDWLKAEISDDKTVTGNSLMSRPSHAAS